MNSIIFPEWTNKLRPLLGTTLLFAPVYIWFLLSYGVSPKTISVGYQPQQPVPFSHRQHAGDLRLDCRYCHNTVEKEEHAAVPPTATCMNCHKNIYPDSLKLALVRESNSTGKPIPWRRVHDLPDHVYFNHAAHVRAGEGTGIGCVSCHGRIDTMEIVSQAEPLNMGWCLDCHRAPEDFLRPADKVTDMTWKAEDQNALGLRLKEQYDINPSEDCSTCHR